MELNDVGCCVKIITIQPNTVSAYNARLPLTLSMQMESDELVT